MYRSTMEGSAIRLARYSMRLRALLSGIAVLVLALVISACGTNAESAGSDEQAGAETTEDAGLSEEEMQAYASEDLEELVSEPTSEESLEAIKKSTAPLFTDADASSELPAETIDGVYYSYGPKNVLSYDTDTAWNEGVSGPGIGQWIRLKSNATQAVRGINILNGYAYSPNRYVHNNRPKRFIVELSDGTVWRWNLEDAACQWQTGYLPETHYVTWIKFTIEDVYRSDGRFDDTCITSIMVF